MNYIDYNLKKNLWYATQYAYAIEGRNKFKSRPYFKEYYEKAELKDKIYSFVNKKNKIDAALIALSDIGLIIAFRGTEFNISDWINNIDASLVPMFPFGNVHHGFLTSIESISDDIINAVEYLYPLSKIKKIYITGHSKGGALAILMACKMPKKYYKDITVVTFGSPRVGDREFFNNYKFETYRYEEFLDLVPHLPFSQEEQKLIPRLSPIYSKVLPITVKGLKFFKQIVTAYGKLPPYCSVGTYIRINKPHDKFSEIPSSINKFSGENLDSLIAIEWMMRTKYIRILPCTHSFDYKD